MQDEIARSAYVCQKEIEQDQKIIVGVNKFTANEKDHTGILKVDDSIRQGQVEKLKALRAMRDNNAINTLIEKIEMQARSGENLMPVVVEAVEQYATLGEIADALRRVLENTRFR